MRAPSGSTWYASRGTGDGACPAIAATGWRLWEGGGGRAGVGGCARGPGLFVNGWPVWPDGPGVAELGVTLG